MADIHVLMSSKFVVLLTLGSAALVSAQITYNAPTDRIVRPKPPLPALGPAGTVITDPTYGNRILRVTDGYTVAKAPQTSYTTTAGAFVSAWNADSTRFYVKSSGGDLVFNFDKTAFRATPAGVLPVSGAAFASDDPNVIYGVWNRMLASYNFRTGQIAPFLILDMLVPNYPQYEYAVSVSADGKRFANSFAGMQDTYRYCVWYDRSQGLWHLLDVVASTIDGRPAGVTFGASTGIHSQDLDKSGRYVALFLHNGAYGYAIWDAVGGTLTVYPSDPGHMCLDFGREIAQSGIQVDSTSESRGFTTRVLPAGSRVQMVSPPPPPPHSWNYAGHWSCGSAAPGQMNPIVGSFYRDSFDTSRPWAWLDDEVVGVATDKPGTIYRFAHHRSLFDASNFWTSPRGNLSQDGKYFIFTSNWEKTLGTDPDGVGRLDVFLVQLPLATR